MGHDSESIISIPKCSNPGCYSKAISYQNASLLQMKALAEISADCSQSIWVNLSSYLDFQMNNLHREHWNRLIVSEDL